MFTILPPGICSRFRDTDHSILTTWGSTLWQSAPCASSWIRSRTSSYFPQLGAF